MSNGGSQQGFMNPPAGTLPGSRHTGGRGFDISALVNRVSDEYHRNDGIVVNDSARATLIRPALPHAQAVAEALSREEISIQFLEECVRSMLSRAHRIATERRLTQIDAACAQAAMDEDCPYLGWC